MNNKGNYDVATVSKKDGLHVITDHRDDGADDGTSPTIDMPDVGYMNDAYKASDYAEDQRKISQEEASSNMTSEDAKVEVKNISILKLFRYADVSDWLMMVVATVMSIINGILQPISFIIFGKLIDQFIDLESAKTVNIEAEMTTFALYYVYAAIAVIFSGYIGNTLWLYASIRQTHIIRTSCFQSILRQDIGWFDVTDSGELSTRLTDDITKIQNGIGDKIGAFMAAISMLLAGFVIGMFYSWKLTLVIISTSPVMIIAAFGTGKVIAMITSEEQTAYAKAGSIAEEVLSSIRTVVAFGGEEKEITRYKGNLQEAEKAGIKKGLSGGFAFGLFNAVIFASCGLGFWFGGTEVIDGNMTGGEVLLVFLVVIIGASQFGQTGPNIEYFMTARGAAYYIYELIDRKPTIDSMSNEGLRPAISGDVKFVDCKFVYPSRPDVKVELEENLNFIV